MSEKWYSIDVAHMSGAAEAVELAFGLAEAVSTATSFRRENETSETQIITGYFNNPPDVACFEKALNEALVIHGFDRSAIMSLATNEVENEDWLAEWKKYWQPTKSGRFIVAPPWSEIRDGEEFVIRIDPNMAFGTGTHETTRLCLEAIDAHYRAGWSFYDVGTGTGLLAIAAAMLGNGSEKISACDNDAEAVRIAKENAAANNSRRIAFREGPFAFDGRKFDMVCANLTLDVILPILRDLLHSTEKVLVLSGILTEQETAISEALTNNGSPPFVIDRLGEWIKVTADFQE